MKHYDASAATHLGGTKPKQSFAASVGQREQLSDLAAAKILEKNRQFARISVLNNSKSIKCRLGQPLDIFL